MPKPIEYISNPRVVLTMDQARELQRTAIQWPAQWRPLLDVSVPKEVNATVDLMRVHAALFMMRLDCEEDQIVQQLHTKANGTVMKMARRQLKAERKGR